MQNFPHSKFSLWPSRQTGREGEWKRERETSQVLWPNVSSANIQNYFWNVLNVSLTSPPWGHYTLLSAWVLFSFRCSANVIGIRSFVSFAHDVFCNNKIWLKFLIKFMRAHSGQPLSPFPCVVFALVSFILAPSASFFLRTAGGFVIELIKLCQRRRVRETDWLCWLGWTYLYLQYSPAWIEWIYLYLQYLLCHLLLFISYSYFVSLNFLNTGGPASAAWLQLTFVCSVATLAHPGGQWGSCVFYSLLTSNYFCNPLSFPTIVLADNDDDADWWLPTSSSSLSNPWTTQLWTEPLRNYKVQSTGGQKQWYLLSLFIGDAVRDVPLCKHLAKRMPCPGTGPLPPPQPR